MYQKTCYKSRCSQFLVIQNRRTFVDVKRKQKLKNSFKQNFLYSFSKDVEWDPGMVTHFSALRMNKSVIDIELLFIILILEQSMVHYSLKCMNHPRIILYTSLLVGIYIHFCKYYIYQLNNNNSCVEEIVLPKHQHNYC